MLFGEMDENDGRELRRSPNCDEDDDDGGRLVVVATIGTDVDEDDTGVAALEILAADFPRIS